MSLSSLRSFSGAASYATAAFDTARTTFKAMADAAVPPAGSETADGQPHAAAVTPPPPGVAEAEREAERSTADKRKAGIRKGIALDAYA